MHTQPMSEMDGEFTKPPEKDSQACRSCGKDEVYCETWESSCGGYEDYHYTCRACGASWWIDGIDS